MVDHVVDADVINQIYSKMDIHSDHMHLSFITVTLRPKLYKYSSVTQLELSNNILYNILDTYCVDWACVAEHTGGGNIHYHAIVLYLGSAALSMINTIKKNKNFGMIKFDKSINNLNRAKDYVLKSLNETRKVCHGNNGHKPYYCMSANAWQTICGHKN